MKRMLSLATSILILMLLNHSGNLGNSAIYAASRSASDKRVIEHLFAGWNAHDLDKVAAAFSEDAVYEDVAAGHISHGRSEVRKWAEGAFSVFDDFKMEVVSSSVRSGRGSVEWVWSAIDKAQGKAFSVRGVSLFEIRSGKIARYKEYYDVAAIMRQVGVLPAEKK